MMNYFQRRKVLNNINTMDLTPVRMCGHEIEDGKVVVMIPKFKGKVYHLIAPFTAKLFFRIKLDNLGSITWHAIDGEKNVQDICNYVRDKGKNENLDLLDLDDRLSKYMMMLYERRFISFKQIINI